MARWFSHDSNARNSKKLFRVRQKFGAAGYGIYFMLIEMLRDADDNYLTLDYDMLAFDIREDAELIRHIVEDFGLFCISDGVFTSEGLQERLTSNFRSIAGKKGAEARWGKQENPNEMAQNGKNDGKAIASDSKPCEAMPFNIMTNTKQREIHKESCCCSSSTVSAYEEGKGFSIYSLPEELRNNEQQQIFENFFFRDFKNPKSEVEKFIAHNENFRWIPKGQTEPLATAEERVRWSDGWKPKTQPRTNRPDFLAAWKRIYELCARSDPDVAALMLDTKAVAGKLASGRNYIRCATQVWQWIEQHKEETHPIIRALFRGEIWVYYNT